MHRRHRPPVSPRRLILGGISTTLLVILTLIGWQISSSILRQFGGEPQAASEIMQRVANGDLTACLDKAPEGSRASGRLDFGDGRCH